MAPGPGGKERHATMFHSRPPSFPPTSSSLSPRAEVSRLLPSPGCVSELWEYEYELYGGAQLAPPTSPVCVCKIPHAPERGMRRSPRNGPPPSEHEV
eukprot:scaffold11177_cov86-Isochrysis_galbana.AAC.3